MVVDHFIFGLESGPHVATQDSAVIWSGETTPGGSAVFRSSGGGEFVIAPLTGHDGTIRKKPHLPQSGDGSQSAAADLLCDDVYDVAGRRVAGPLPSGIYFRRIAGIVRRFVVLR